MLERPDVFRELVLGVRVKYRDLQVKISSPRFRVPGVELLYDLRLEAAADFDD